MVNTNRTKAMEAINKTFFQGYMAPLWYTYIDEMYNRYNFDDEVMMTLFSYCYNNNKSLVKNYVKKVAEGWSENGVKNYSELEEFFGKSKLKEMQNQIIKILNLRRNLTEYENSYLIKWVQEFQYDFDIIELALKKTTRNTNPNFNYVNTVINDWYNRGFKNKEEIRAYEESRKIPKEKISIDNVICKTDNSNLYKPIFYHESEITLYRALLELFPQYFIFPNISLVTIFDVDKLKKLLEPRIINYMFKAHVDFAIVNTSTYLPIIALEKDSFYHDTDSGIQKDEMKNKIFKVGGIPLIRIRFDKNADVTFLKNIISENVKGLL